MDLGGPPVPSSVPAAPFASSGLDLLSGGLDGLLGDSPAASPQHAAPAASVGLLGDIFGLAPSASTSYVAPKQVSSLTHLQHRVLVMHRCFFCLFLLF